MHLMQRGPAIFYHFVPKEDITAYELALIIPVLVEKDAESVKALPPECQRHFKVVQGG